MDSDVVTISKETRGVATVTLNRPAVNNAYNREMLEALSHSLATLRSTEGPRVLVLRGNGRHFQAGVDLVFQSELAAASEAENDAVSRLLTRLMRDLNEFPAPTIALIHGACIGGGTGFAASCDIVIAGEDAFFAVAEVRWGAHAGPIFPQLIAAIGVRQLRRYAITAERFGARRALELGLVHEVCPAGLLDDAAAPVIRAILENGPLAVRRSKALMLQLADATVDDDRVETLAREHAETRRSEEAREGFRSFAEKRVAAWQPART